jgi:AAA+ ATPase superfamily predicted ATPase
MEKSLPFFIGAYEKDANYFSRDEEMIRLTTQANNRVNTILLGLPRIGKTTLIHQAADQLENKYGQVCLYLDILFTEDLKGFAKYFNSELSRKFPDKLKESSDVRSEREVEQLINLLFGFLDKQKQKVVICIDEFQQVIRYPEKNAITIMRNATQKLKNACFIFGCQSEYLLNDFFDDSKQGFFINFDLVQVNPIKQNAYSQFIRDNFSKYKIEISTDAVNFILRWTNRHTYYTQLLCKRLFDAGLKEIDIENVHEECGKILKENEPAYFMYRNLLSPVQWLLLKAIAKEEKVYHPTAKQFLMQNNIGTPANVQRALEALLNKEMVLASHDEKGRYFQVHNTFLSRWLEGLD